MVWWTIEKEFRFKQLVEQGFTGSEIAAKLSAEFNEYFSPDSIFHKSSRLGLALRGRSPKSYDVEPSDPFGAPSWLEKELAKEEEKEDHSRPRKVVCVGWRESPEEVTEELENQRIEEGYRELWRDYVSEVLRKGRCDQQQADRALKSIPEWFRRWAEVILVIGYDLGNATPFSEQFERVVEEVVEIESKGKSDKELHEDLEELEAINRAVSEGQRAEAKRKALEEAEN